MRSHAEVGLGALAAALLLASAAVPARAQDSDDLKRGVARISLMDGEVSVKRGASADWVAGIINAPLLTDDWVATGQNSRGEIQFDAANVLRIGGNSEIHIAQLETGLVRVEIARGTVTFRVLRAPTSTVELNTPCVSVRPSREGAYRISVTEAGETEVTARAGDVEVFSPKGSQWVYAGQTMMARGNPNDPEFQMLNAIPADDWDRWNDGRDHALLQSSNSYQYVPQGVYGAEDLDSAGTWTYVAPYGYCWRPTVVTAGWAPYRSGRWAWDDWYGWSWVSYDPWGWAPYHYGRWFFDVRLGWNWYPGAMGVRHYWSPALVGFFGYGGGAGFGGGFGFGNIGWVPLAPYETFHPWWGRGRGEFNRNVNVTNINVTNIYRNARVNNGISGMRADDFGSGRFGNIQHVGSTQVQQAGVVTGRLPMTPTSASRRFSDRAVTNIPRSSPNTHFYSRPANIGQGSGARPVAAPQTSPYRRFGDPGANPPAANPRSIQPPAGNSQVTPRQSAGPQGAPRNDRQPATQPNNSWGRFGTPGASTPPSRQPYNPPVRQAQPPSSSPQAGRTYSPPRPAPNVSAPPSRPAPSAPPRAAPPSSGGSGRQAGGSGGKGRK